MTNKKLLEKKLSERKVAIFKLLTEVFDGDAIEMYRTMDLMLVTPRDYVMGQWLVEIVAKSDEDDEFLQAVSQRVSSDPKKAAAEFTASLNDYGDVMNSALWAGHALKNNA